MADGHMVPQLSRQECIDIMVQVLSGLQVHVDAAKGFIKTGIRVPLDGSQDIEICREAFHLWSAGGFREKANAAKADAREERRREKDGLKWSYEDVFRLVRPYEHTCTSFAKRRWVGGRSRGRAATAGRGNSCP